jgi:hypothetical protein
VAYRRCGSDAHHAPTAPTALTTRQITSLLMRQPKDLKPDEQSHVYHIRSSCPQLDVTQVDQPLAAAEAATARQLRSGYTSSGCARIDADMPMSESQESVAHRITECAALNGRRWAALPQFGRVSMPIDGEVDGVEVSPGQVGAADRPECYGTVTPYHSGVGVLADLQQGHPLAGIG